ncbi:citrate synthase [Silvimonas iriomotensis]|uniref:citrate synthase (unknown stereospecificity) n=1 Tax=Silvimonas iriomotensis TaxID=449662 RepID=A0ABQ2PAK3_9NEIS|nr:citrate synthase [Silvimonas iriomotensis]GGP22075.1 citrate synthase [Silvimonas iriomotensis]
MATGLDGVIAAQTRLSHVDGEAGRLILRGFELEQLAGHWTFEEVAALLWQDIVPHAADLAGSLGQARCAAWQRFHPLLPQLAGMSAIEGMRFLLAAVPDEPADATGLLGAAGVAMAAALRAATNAAPLSPNADAGHAADLLRMLRGQAGDASEVRAFETYLVAAMDHGLNASTFTARVVASTEAGLASAVVAALGALKGPLHGGAPGPVLDMLDAIAEAANADAWIDAAIARGERLMGFGHRIYRVRDPRADVLKHAVSGLRGRDNRIALAEAVEQAGLKALARHKPGRRLDVNTEFYTALLLEALAIARCGFTPVFAAARTAGWIAHACEQQQTGRLLRPASQYIGPWPEPQAA